MQELMTYLLGAVVLIALGVIFFCNKQQGNPKMQTVSLIMLLVAVVAGIGLVWNMVAGGTSDKERAKVGDVMYASEGYKFGKMISEASAGGNVLVVMDENAAGRAENEKGSREALFIDALKSADSALNVSIVIPQPVIDPKTPAEMIPSLMFTQIVKPEDFNKVIDSKNPSAIVFACQMPNNFTTNVDSFAVGVYGPNDFKCLRKNAADKVPVYFTDLVTNGNIAADMLAEKRITAAVERVRGVKATDITSDDYATVFSTVWKLIEPSAPGVKNAGSGRRR